MVERAAAILENQLSVRQGGQYIIRPYRSGDETGILELFQRVFGVERTVEHWRWKFQDNPAGACFLRLAETVDGTLVGQYALLPVRTRWGNETVTFIQVIDVMVDPNQRRGLRRPGLFADLADQSIMAFLRGGQALVGYGFPTPDHLRIGRRVSGYVSLQPIQTLVKNLNSEHGKEGQRAWLLAVEELSRFGSELDGLWQRCQQGPSVGIIRDARYMNWRYVEHPDVTYRLWAARRRLSGSLEGATVLRLGWGDQPIACLVDWLVPAGTVGVAKALLGHCERVARDAGMTQLQAWFSPYAWPYHFLVDHGYRPAPTGYHLVALATDPRVSLEWANTRWYYTMGDSDIY